MNDHPEPSTEVKSGDEEQPDSASGDRFNDDSTVGFQ
jgi:hypothetical protein